MLAVSWGSSRHGTFQTTYLLGTNDPCTHPAKNQSLFWAGPGLGEQERTFWNTRPSFSVPSLTFLPSSRSRSFELFC